MAIIYTAISVPYNTLSALITRDPDDRTQLATYRQLFGFIGPLLIFMTYGVKGGVQVYYCKYVMGNDNYYSFMATAGQIPNIICCFLVPPIAKKIGKRNISMIGCVIAILGGFIMLIGFPILVSVITLIALKPYHLDAEYPRIMKDLEEKKINAGKTIEVKPRAAGKNTASRGFPMISITRYVIS